MLNIYISSCLLFNFKECVIRAQCHHKASSTFCIWWDFDGCTPCGNIFTLRSLRSFLYGERIVCLSKFISAADHGKLNKGVKKRPNTQYDHQCRSSLNKKYLSLQEISSDSHCFGCNRRSSRLVDFHI